MFFYRKTNNQFALYARLSSEDGDKAESCSIANQRELIHAYIKNHPEFTIVKEYTDDGYSGTNFERPGFKQMMEDAKKGIINGIIVKTYPVWAETISKWEDIWNRYSWL